MTLTHIVAASTNNVIGKDYQLLWTLPNDMKHFKNKTWALPVVMGRKTFFSLGSKPLNGRLNVVITNQKDFVAEGVKVVQDIDAAIAYCKQEDYKEIMIIGGGQIYKQTLPIANKIYLTRVHTIVEGDTYYPELNPDEWYLEFEENFDADAKHAFGYSFQTWKRRQ
jgi:dihydrofolate reductase